MPRLPALLTVCCAALFAQPEIAPDRRVTFRLAAPKVSQGKRKAAEGRQGRLERVT